jgi:hypothetical protein
MVTPDPTVPSPIDEWAQACVRFVQDAVALTLDFTPETLPILDHYVRTKANRPTEQIRDLLTPALGAYFGEVIRRSMEGVRWHVGGEDQSAYRIEFDAVFLHFNPLGIAAEIVAQEETELAANFQLLDEARIPVEDALAKDGEVRSEDYYSFTIRYETLELVISVLGALETAQQPAPRRFGPEIYRAAAGETLGGGNAS